MKRRRIGLAAAAVAVVVLAALYAQKKPADKLLVLDWAEKSSLERPPVAVSPAPAPPQARRATR